MDDFTEVTSKSWFDRIAESIKGVLVGGLLFLVSFVILFWNEGRAVQTAKSLEEGQGLVVSLPSAEKVDSANEGKLIHVSGLATTKDTLADPKFGINAPDTIKLIRKVEMYQWKEDKKTETSQKVGGKEETKTTYSYATTWSDRLIDSSAFNQNPQSVNKINPPKMPFENMTWTAKTVSLGAFTMPSTLVDRLSNETPLDVTPAMLEKLPSEVKSGDAQVVDNGFYLGKSPTNPSVGDVRIHFQVVKPSEVSIIAKQTGNSFEGFKTKAGDTLMMLESGKKSAAEMFASALKANETMTWILRLVGFLAMAIGLYLVFRPLVMVAAVLPFLGDLLGIGVGFFAVVVALPLSLITIGIAWLVYRPLLGIGILVLAVALIIGGKKLASKMKQAKPTA